MAQHFNSDVSFKGNICQWIWGILFLNLPCDVSVWQVIHLNMAATILTVYGHHSSCSQLNSSNFTEIPIFIHFQCLMSLRPLWKKLMRRKMRLYWELYWCIWDALSIHSKLLQRPTRTCAIIWKPCISLVDAVKNY